MALQTANQFQLGTDFSRLGSGIQQGQQIANQFQIGQQNKAIGERNTTKFDQEQSTIRATVLNKLATSMKTVPPEQRQAFLQNQAPELAKFNIDAGVFAQEPLDDASLDEAIAGTQSFIAQKEAAPGFSLGQGQKRFDAAGNEIASVDAKPEKPISALDQAKIDNLKAETEVFKGNINTKDLDTLVSEASPELQKQAKAAYSLSGGGDKGVKAVKEVLETGVELERRAKAPELLKANFPQADEAELQELQAVVDSAKTTESGFKAASDLRDKQRQVKKGKVFQKRAVELLDRILNADELNDVIGSFEGSDESIIPFGGKKIRGDAESELIADIEEAGNILTADNLDIMSGVLSETDIKIIANLAGGALNRKRGEEAFKRDVSKLKEKLQNAIGVVGGNKLPSGTKDNGNGTFTLPSGQVVRRKRD